MRKILILFVSVFMFVQLQAQTDTSYWNNGGSIALNGSQSSFTNWAKGGENQIAATGSVILFAKYLKAKNSWDNLLLMDLGFSKQGYQDYRKSDDRIEFNTKYGHKANKNWYYSALFNFKSQFTNGYEYPNDSTVTYTSSFMAPGYFKLGLGMDYKPNDKLSIFLSPATAKLTYVKDQLLADNGKFGLDPAIRDTSGNIISPAKKSRMEVGALFRLTYSKDVWTNVNFATILELYSDYLQNPQNIDIDWQFVITLKVNEFLNAQVKGHLIYDDDIMIDVDRNGDGINDAVGPRTQFNEALSIGLVYKL